MVGSVTWSRQGVVVYVGLNANTPEKLSAENFSGVLLALVGPGGEMA